MGYHTFDVDRADELEDAAFRYRHLSVEELLWHLSSAPDDAVVDLGSGTGFYTDDVAPRVDSIHAVDVQTEMHDLYREKGVPENVELVTAGVDDLPFDDDRFDAALATMTYHEFAGPAALSEVARVVHPGGRLVVADWSSDGAGETGPPTDERFAADEATSALRDAGFDVEFDATRTETFILVAVRR